MKFTKYIAASMIALAGLTSCSDSFLETEYTNYLDEEAAAEAAGKNPDVFLNGMWSWMVTYSQTGSGAHDDFGYMGSLHATDMMSTEATVFLPRKIINATATATATPEKVVKMLS